MKLPSINYLLSQAITTLRRFYLPILFAILGTCTAVYSIEKEYTFGISTKLIHTCLVIMPFSLGCMLFAERTTSFAIKKVLPFIILVLAWAYYLIAPAYYFVDFHLSLTFLILCIVMHLWVAIAPYVGNKEQSGFWSFNESLYARMIVSLLFSAILYAGLALALEACNQLLKMNFNYKTFANVWLIVIGLFNTWFFLAGVPDNYIEINSEKPFPKGLKIFTQYILIPLVLLYMLILYAYGIKIILNHNLPKGWVSILILCYSVVGILAMLLVNPLRNDKENTWVRLFSKFFFLATLPLIILLYAAIWVRVKEYGITESRYYLIILGAWLFGTALYFIFSRLKNIKTIPISLTIIGLLSLFGPWSVFSTSQYSQLHRLEKILERNHIWSPGKTVSNPAVAIKREDAIQVKDIIEYFVNHKATQALQPLYTSNIQNLTNKIIQDSISGSQYYNTWQRDPLLTDTLTTMLHVDINMETAYDSAPYFTISKNSRYIIAGYNYAFEYGYSVYNNRKETMKLSANDSLNIELNGTELCFYKEKVLVSKVKLQPLLTKLKERSLGNKISISDIPVGDMTVIAGGNPELCVIIKEIELIYRDPGIQTLNAIILIK